MGEYPDTPERWRIAINPHIGTYEQMSIPSGARPRTPRAYKSSGKVTSERSSPEESPEELVFISNHLPSPLFCNFHPPSPSGHLFAPPPRRKYLLTPLARTPRDYSDSRQELSPPHSRGTLNAVDRNIVWCLRDRCNLWHVLRRWGKKTSGGKRDFSGAGGGLCLSGECQPAVREFGPRKQND